MRGVAVFVLRLAKRLLTPRNRSWGEAAQREAEEIEHPGEALRFAFGCLMWAIREAAADRISHLFQQGDDPMSFADAIRGPRGVALLCATGAVALGLVYMVMGNAPARYLMMNIGAFAFGLIALAILTLADGRGHLPGRLLAVGLGAVLLATSLLGVRVDGITRWLALGPLTIQPSMMILPLMVVLFARFRDGLSLIGIAVAALALALQPDRGMAGALTAGIAVLAFTRPNRSVLAALACAAAGFAATLVQPDPSPALPFVDQILYSSFSLHPLAGVAVVLGSALLTVPVLAGRQAKAPELAVFGAVWAALIAAAALGNYPTPLVGYGGSAVIGYLISLMVFPRRSALAAASTEAQPQAGASSDGDRALYVGAARAQV
ncbi:hypothetical protein [Brevundimonas sp.]|uniref:hypothetical protein n=1 Tax=Brevundimonas sp. TaxID=1871086 RepID=UPI003F7292F4